MIFRFVLQTGPSFTVNHTANTTPSTIVMRRATVLQISNPPGVPDVTIISDPFVTFDRIRTIGSPVHTGVYYQQEPNGS